MVNKNSVAVLAFFSSEVALASFDVRHIEIILTYSGLSACQ